MAGGAKPKQASEDTTQGDKGQPGHPRTGRVQNGRRPVPFMTHSLLRTGSDRSRLVRTGPFKYLVKGTGFDFLQVRLHLGREPVLLMTCTKTPTGSFVV